MTGTTPPPTSGGPLDAFLEFRRTLRTERVGDGGPGTCAALTAHLDAALEDLGGGHGSGAAVVALGGYGRGEQCLWSDVDVMVLHTRRDPDPLVKGILYPLWDSNLKVGHAVRTPKECRTAAGESLETLTSLLSARLVVGDRVLYDDLLEVMASLLRGHPLASRLAEEERKRRLADPYPVMAADLKEGRGALRTHQGFWWERRRAELLGLPVDGASAAERAAHATLLGARNALHAAAGRAADEFLVDLREPAARWLGTDVASLAAAITLSLERGDRLADVRWPDLHAEQDQLVGLGRRVVRSIRSRFSAPAGTGQATATGVLPLAARAAARPQGAWFEPDELEAIRTSTPTEWTDADRAAFLSLISAGARGRTIFGLLEDAGWVARELPEWPPVATAPQLAPFHEHPAGAHLWRCVEELLAVIDGSGEPAQIAAEVGSTDDLVLAAFFHDIGKARGGDHANVGAELAAGFLRRTGYGPATIAVVTDAVRHHLLLSETATRRDFADPVVIDEVASIVGELRQLQVLYLLTIADLRATGRTMWNPWRAGLLRSLYVRVAEALERGGAVRATPDIDAVLASAGGSFDRRSVEEHIAAMAPDYLDTASPEEVIRHLRAATGLRGPASITVDPTSADRVLVAGADRAGFLLAVCRAFTANGVGVVDARLRTRADGTALDTFLVRNDRTGEAITGVGWDRVQDDLIASLEGTRDLRPAIKERVRAYRRSAHDRSGVRVKAGRSGRHTQIEVRAPDRIGLLADIVDALHAEGLDVQFARIDTMGDEARDVFHVRRAGVPISPGPELDALRRRLEDRLRS